MILEKDFIEELIDVMDTEEELTMESNLGDIDEWDSLSYVAFLAMCTSITDKPVDPKAVKAATTVRDLYNLVAE